jgi:DNA-directed RNA polymerase III subunit RPC2
MGLTSDKEIAQLICGNDPVYLNFFSPSLEEAAQTKLFTQLQCLEFIGNKLKISRKGIIGKVQNATL